MSAPILVWVVGPQGSGKTPTAELLAAGYAARGTTCAHITDEAAWGMSRDALLSWPRHGVLIVESSHDDDRRIAADEQVIKLERRP